MGQESVENVGLVQHHSVLSSFFSPSWMISVALRIWGMANRGKAPSETCSVYPPSIIMTVLSASGRLKVRGSLSTTMTGILHVASSSAAVIASEGFSCTCVQSVSALISYEGEPGHVW